MKNYNHMTFDLEERYNESLIVAKQTYVDRLTQKPAKEYPPDYAIVAVNQQKEAMLIIRASKAALIELGKNLVMLEDEKDE